MEYTGLDYNGMEYTGLDYNGMEYTGLAYTFKTTKLHVVSETLSACSNTISLWSYSQTALPSFTASTKSL